MSESLNLILKELRKQIVPKTTITVLSDSADDYSTLAEFGKHAITNRFDIKERYKKAFAQVHFNDFIFPEHLKVQRVILPVSKEKAQTHYLINQAMAKLPRMISFDDVDWQRVSQESSTLHFRVRAYTYQFKPEVKSEG